MKQRKLVIGLLVILAVAVSGFTFAFWAGSVTGIEDDIASATVTIGEGNTVTTTVTIDDETSVGALVPVGREEVSAGSPVEYVVLTFQVDWNSTDTLASGVAGTLAVVVGDRLVNAVAYNSLFEYEVRIGGASAPTVSENTGNYEFAAGSDNTAILTDGALVNVYVLVWMNEPADQATYNAVATESLQFNLTFDITVD